VKGIEMEADFEGEMEDIPPNDDSDSDDPEGEQDQDRLQQVLGVVGDTGETVDERLWGDEDKPEEGQQGPEKKEKDSSVQVYSPLLQVRNECSFQCKTVCQVPMSVAGSAE
jgi:midasin (ATPase involved in ribosome maturation)